MSSLNEEGQTAGKAEGWARLCLYRERDAEGHVQTTLLASQPDGLFLLERGSAALLPEGAVEAVFKRYGRPLSSDSQAQLRREGGSGAAAETLALPAGTLQAFRFRPHGWIQPLDYLLWTSTAAAEPLVAPTPLVSAALRALAAVLRQRQAE